MRSHSGRRLFTVGMTAKLYSGGGEEVWEQSEKEGLQRLLNLVSDEHLERNLRARDRHFGDQLKQLAAYAFQHTAREVAIDHTAHEIGLDPAEFRRRNLLAEGDLPFTSPTGNVRERPGA